MNTIDDDTLVRYAEQSLTRPPDFGYFGSYPLFESWGMTPIGQHRDSDALDRSNYRRILEDMTKAHPDEDMGDNVLEWVADFRAGDWAYGWREQIIVRVLYDAEEDITPDNITQAFRKIMEIYEGLRNDYPIYDEEDYSELEYEERMDTFHSTWDDLVRHWDEEDSGPEPDADEKEWMLEQLSGNDDSAYSDEDLIREIMNDKRLEDTLAQYENPDQLTLEG